MRMIRRPDLWRCDINIDRIVMAVYVCERYCAVYEKCATCCFSITAWVASAMLPELRGFSWKGSNYDKIAYGKVAIAIITKQTI
jgi:hypothetical protein